jgi:hypothetical protein
MAEKIRGLHPGLKLSLMLLQTVLIFQVDFSFGFSHTDYPAHAPQPELSHWSFCSAFVVVLTTAFMATDNRRICPCLCQWRSRVGKCLEPREAAPEASIFYAY